jgi:hypothetical protein
LLLLSKQRGRDNSQQPPNGPFFRSPPDLAACVRDRWPPVHIIITTGKARPLEIPANAIFIAKPYVGQAVVDAIRTFENM